MKTETTTKQKFFKELSLIIDKFSNHGIKETTTISLVYQTAFKILEKQNCLKFPIQYIYNDIDFKKELWEKYANEITLVAFHLIYTIQEDEAFNDLISNYIEECASSNKRIGQFFTPNKVSKFIAATNYAGSSVKDFEQPQRVSITDPTGCGVGSMVLQSLQSLKNIEGFTDEHYEKVEVYMVDIDEDLANIAFFQILLNSLFHGKIIGKIVVEAKNVINEYSIIKKPLIFISNINDEKYYAIQKKSTDFLNKINELANKQVIEND